MQWTTIRHQLELRSHSCFVFLINHRLRSYFSKDCWSSYHKCHWCLQGFLQSDHSWLQSKCKGGANASKSQFGQMTVSLPALTKEHGHGAYPTHPSHYRNFSSREALKPNTSVALTWAVPSKYSPRRFSFALPLTFPIIHLAKPQFHSQHLPYSSKIMCTLSQQSRKSWARVSTSCSFPQSSIDSTMGVVIQQRWQ